jgi:hypothetical protein
MKAVRAFVCSGLVVATIAVAGCGGGSSGGATPAVVATATPVGATPTPSPTPSPTPTVAPQTIYVADNATVKGLFVTDSGATAPEYNLTGAQYATTVAFDSAGRIYTAHQGATISVFVAGANGNATPISTIGGSNSNLVRSWQTVVDSGGKIYLDDYSTNRILVFAAGAIGDATPVATISGANTSIDQPTGMALDAAGNLYVASSGGNQILEFAPGANGNVAPAAVLQVSIGAFAVAIDPTGRIVVGSTSGGVNVYAPGAAGSASPVASISGSNTNLVSEYSVATDTSGNIWVGDDNFEYQTNHQSEYRVMEFAATATGDVAPLRTLTNIGGIPYGLAIR